MKSKKITTPPSNTALPKTAPCPAPLEITPIAPKPPDINSDPWNNQRLLTYVKNGIINLKATLIPKILILARS